MAAAALATGTGRCPAVRVTPGAGRRPGREARAEAGRYSRTRPVVLSAADGLAVPDLPAAGAVCWRVAVYPVKVTLF